MLSDVPGQELGGAALTALGAAASTLARLATKQTLNAIFASCLFSIKSENPLQISEEEIKNRY